MLSHIKDGKNQWTVIINNKPYVFDPSHPEYQGLIECVRVGDHEAFVELVNTGTQIENWSEGNFDYIDGFLYYEDEPVRKAITQRILEMIKNGWDHKPMLAFLDRLYSNPSNRAVTEFHDWIQHKGLAITPDGYILGYKGVAVYGGAERDDKMGRKLVSGDGVDRYTGHSYRNNVGDTNEMRRRQVDDNCNNTCSHGLHVGTYEYAEDWAGTGRVMLVKVDPADVVSIPVDCDCQKMRCWKYEVVAEARGILEESVVDEADVDDDYWNDEELEDEYDNLRGDF